MKSYHFVEEETIPSPALIYYRDTIISNSKKAVSQAHGAEHLWPHVKTHKSKQLTDLLVSLGITHFKCSTIAEAEMTAQTDAQHILLAYPLVGPNIERFLTLVHAYPNKTFYTIGDDLSMLSTLGNTAASRAIRVNCLIDVNPGMNRTGVSFDSLVDFYRSAAQLNGLHLCGLHCYDGNRHEESYFSREREVLKTIEQLNNTRTLLACSEIYCQCLIVGGSPTFPCYASDMKDVFFSPGTVFVYDAGYRQQFPDLPYKPGAAILSRVVSHPAKGFFTLDAGYKAISAEQSLRGILPEVPHASEVFQSEEHWTFRMDDGFEQECPSIGQIVYILPWHICPTTALYDSVHVVSDGKIDGNWEITARNRRITI